MELDDATNTRFGIPVIELVTSLSREMLSPGSRVVAVADVFTAVAEDRPYRPAMDDDKVREVMRKSAPQLGADIVDALLGSSESASLARSSARPEPPGDTIPSSGRSGEAHRSASFRAISSARLSSSSEYFRHSDSPSGARHRTK